MSRKLALQCPAGLVGQVAPAFQQHQRESLFLREPLFLGSIGFHLEGGRRLHARGPD